MTAARRGGRAPPARGARSRVRRHPRRVRPHRGLDRAPGDRPALRDLEDEAILGDFKGREGDVISGVIQQSQDPRNVLVDFGTIEGILPLAEQVPGERYVHGERLRCFVVSVKRGPKGPQVSLSRTHPNLVRTLPLRGPRDRRRHRRDRGAGARGRAPIEDRRAPRVAGVNAKGACIGPMGARVRAVMSELRGEKIDIVDYAEDPAAFVAAALSPARVQSVEIVDAEARTARVIVPDYQLSLAMARRGRTPASPRSSPAGGSTSGRTPTPDAAPRVLSSQTRRPTDFTGRSRRSAWPDAGCRWDRAAQSPAEVRTGTAPRQVTARWSSRDRSRRPPGRSPSRDRPRPRTGSRQPVTDRVTGPPSRQRTARVPPRHGEGGGRGVRWPRRRLQGRSVPGMPPVSEARPDGSGWDGGPRPHGRRGVRFGPAPGWSVDRPVPPEPPEHLAARL